MDIKDKRRRIPNIQKASGSLLSIPIINLHLSRVLLSSSSPFHTYQHTHYLHLHSIMAAAQMTTAASSRGFLPPFEGVRPVTLKVSSLSFRASGGLTLRSTRGLVVKAATTVAPKYTTLKPLGDRVLVKISAAEEKTSGGILLPSTAQSKPQGRTVGQHKVDVSVKTGIQVIYSKYAGTEVEFNGSNHLLLKEDDIVGILEMDDVKDLKPLNDF